MTWFAVPLKLLHFFLSAYVYESFTFSCNFEVDALFLECSVWELYLQLCKLLSYRCLFLFLRHCFFSLGREGWKCMHFWDSVKSTHGFNCCMCIFFSSFEISLQRKEVCWLVICFSLLLLFSVFLHPSVCLSLFVHDCLPVCLSLSLSLYLSVFASLWASASLSLSLFLSLSVSLPLSVCLSLFVHECLPVCLSISVSFSLSVPLSMSICLSLCFSVSLPACLCLSVCLPVCLCSVCLSAEEG